MCGITGWVSYDQNLETQKHVIAAMTRTMARRGPDAEGIWVTPHAALGHRRLAVVDLEGGVQPMLAEEDGKTLATLVYAGEIYNFTELRRELESLGHRFRTRSDTEVVLRGYLQWGEGVAERLNGMFAFAVWDVRREELFLIRDRMGVKPLYYTQTADGVLFGSEPKAILAHPSIRPRVDEDGFREWLTLVKNPEAAIYAGMHEVRPGYAIKVNRNGLTKRCYWRLSARPHEDDLATTVETVSHLLDDIVTRTLVSDVPLCSLLSGGIDSSAITALANRSLREQNGRRVRSFSVDFAGQDKEFVPNNFNVAADGPYIRDFVAHSGSNHTDIVLDSREIADRELRRTVIRAADHPMQTGGEIYSSLFCLFEAIRKESTVALSGEFSDELFGGYSWFYDPKAVAAHNFPWLASVGEAWDGTRAIHPDLLERLNLVEFRADSYSKALAEVPRLEGEDATQRRMREMNYIFLTRFGQFLLDRKDRTSMAVGLEVRVPFCDHRLVEYVFNIPWKLKTFDGREKSILRAATRDILPTSIVDRRKNPYPSTQDPSYEQAVRNEVTKVLADPADPANSFLNRAALEDMLATPVKQNGVWYHRTSLERVASLSMWMEDYDLEVEL